MQFHPQFLFTTQFINMPSQEVSTNNHGREDVPQRNEIVVDEEGSQNISEAVEEPPTKRSKIDKIPKTVVLEALDGLREADERLLSLYEETLQMKDDEINLLRKQITDYARERREMLKYIDEAESVIKTTESYQTSVIMVTHNLSSTSNTFVSLNRAVMGITRLYGLERCVLCVAVSGMDL